MLNNIFKISSDNLCGTAFHGDYIVITPNKLKELFGEPSCTGDLDDKTQAEWALVYNNIPFALYDWKEYEDFGWDNEIEYHIGTHTANESHIIYDVLTKVISNL